MLFKTVITFIGTGRDYDTVKRIRNNTHVCLYYLLGGFKLLNKNISCSEQLGIVDYSFEELYQDIRQHNNRLLWLKTSDGYEGLAYYLNDDIYGWYNESGILNGTELKFIKIPGNRQDSAPYSLVEDLSHDPTYVKNNTLIVKKNQMPSEIVPIPYSRKKRV